MGLAWNVTAMSGGNMTEGPQKQVQGLLDQWSDLVGAQLASRGYPLHASPIFRPFNITVLLDKEQVHVAFSPAAGMPTHRWIDESDDTYEPGALTDFVVGQQGESITAQALLPRPDSPNRRIATYAAAVDHVDEIDRAQALGKLGDLDGVRHLEPQLREFIADHPNFDKNVFVMMPFSSSAQVTEIHEAIKDALTQRGMHAVRADDRDYTGELWSNIQVYLTGSKYGIAVFEDIEQRRDFNPNVSLELGYMLGRNKRTLLLKEQRLPDLPVDVVHRLYKPFDMFDIGTSVKREVGRWIDVDLRL